MYPGEWVFISPDLIQLLTCYLEFTLIAPIIEELIYRKYLLKILNQKFNIYLSVIISSFLFYLMHLPSTQTVAINFGYHLITKTLFGMLLSVIYLKSHSIKNSMIVHMLWNASVTTFSLNPEEVSVFFYDIPLYVNEQHLIIGITLIESILLIIFMFIVIKIESSHKRHISTVY